MYAMAAITPWYCGCGPGRHSPGGQSSPNPLKVPHPDHRAVSHSRQFPASKLPSTGRRSLSSIMPPTPHPKTPPISPIFIADNVTLVVSREKRRESAAGLCRTERCEGLSARRLRASSRGVGRADPPPRRRQLKAPAIGHVIGDLPGLRPERPRRTSGVPGAFASAKQ